MVFLISILCFSLINAFCFRNHGVYILNLKKITLSLIVMGCVTFSAIGQTTVKGKIIDKQTRQPIPAVTVTLPEIKAKTLSNSDGYFHIHTTKQVRSITFSAIGYKTFHYPLSKSSGYQLNIELEETTNTLDNVSIVATKRARYTNKNNPAVELIRNIIANRDKNRRQQDHDVVFKQYEKLNLALNMKLDQVRSSSIIRKFPFLLKTADSIKRPGRSLIPLFMRERLSLCLETKNIGNNRKQILDEKQSRIDQYFDEDGIDEYLSQIYQYVDIYDSDIGIGSQRFLSPIAALAPELYKYFIADTLKDVNPHVVRLMFSPRNKQDQLFMGEMRIPLNGDYAVADITLTLNKDVNLNFVNDFEVNISYEKDAEGKYYIAKSVTDMGLGLFKDKYSIFGTRTLLTTDYRFAEKDFVFPALTPVNAKRKGAETFKRPEGLTSLEQNAYNNIDSLKKSPKFKRMAAISALILTGFQKVGPVDIGPLGSIYSFNKIEGTRIRLSGRTNADFSDKVVLEGHLARGMKDEKWKYSISAAYSFKPEGPLQFPIHSLTVKHSYETQIPGQDLNFVEDDNFLLSFKRGVNDKWLYNRKWSAEYFRELENHISFRIGYRNQELDPTDGLIFQPVSAVRAVDRLHLSEFTSELRWAPKQQFYQGKRYRRPIKNAYPIFTLRASAAFKGFLEGDYNYQNVSLHIFKRLFVPPFGYSDIILEGGMVLGKVPFPLLAIHRANQTYSYQNQSYNLMNFMEFMSDRYASINIDHSLNGVVLNKIPLIKRLQLREMATIKVLYGGITSKNLPDNDPDLYRFATNSDGAPTSFELGNAPYIEGSLGIGNIFKLLRIDYVRRFSYLHHPNVSKSGIRAKIHIDF